MEKSYVTIAHYTLAILALVALVIINIWGTVDGSLNVALIGVVTTASWGGVQRELGIKIQPPPTDRPTQ